MAGQENEVSRFTSESGFAPELHNQDQWSEFSYLPNECIVAKRGR